MQLNLNFVGIEWLTHQSGDREVSSVHLFGQPVHLPASINEDDSLCDGQSLVQVTQSVQLPLLRQMRGMIIKGYLACVKLLRAFLIYLIRYCDLFSPHKLDSSIQRPWNPN